jgi:uncharacterized membrane protein YhaH (DUF805 family)
VQTQQIDTGRVTFGAWFARQGRITRRTWWLHYTLPFVALVLLAAIADSALGYPGFGTMPEYAGTLYARTGGPVSTVVELFCLVPAISSGVARLHDRNHSGWWMLFAWLPVIGAIVLFVQQGCLAGDDFDNSYGPAVPPGCSGSFPWSL